LINDDDEERERDREQFPPADLVDGLLDIYAKVERNPGLVPLTSPLCLSPFIYTEW
jgi:hypothetical protein